MDIAEEKQAQRTSGKAARRGKVLAYPVCGENCSLTAAARGRGFAGKALQKALTARFCQFHDRFLPR